jgi:DMATS type aromatic prenyltransferase
VSTYASVAAVQIRGLCESLGLRARTAEVEALFERMTRGWSHHAIDRGPLWASDLTDDHTPYEFSIAFRGDQSELRLLVESQTPRGSVLEQWRAGCALQDELTADLGASRKRFDAIGREFAPRAGCRAGFALWHSVVFDPDGHHLIKVYLNPRIDGRDGAQQRVRVALQAAGCGHAWDTVARLMDPRSEPTYLSLDLVDSGGRVKVYIAHPGTTIDAYCDQLGRLSEDAARDAATLIGPFVDPHRRFEHRPLLTCLGFRGDSIAADVTIHFPVRSYVRSDQDSLDGIATCLHPRALAQLTEALQRLAGGPLRASRGRVSYVSRTRTLAGLRHTIYVAPLCHAERQEAAVASAPSPRP